MIIWIWLFEGDNYLKFLIIFWLLFKLFENDNDYLIIIWFWLFNNYLKIIICNYLILIILTYLIIVLIIWLIWLIWFIWLIDLFDLFDLVLSCQFNIWRAGLLISRRKTTWTLTGGVRDIKQAHHRQIRAWIRAAAQDEGDLENEWMRTWSELLELRCAVARSEVLQRFVKFCNTFKNRVRITLAEYRVICEDESPATTASFKGIILNWKSRTAMARQHVTESEMTMDLQFLEHHKG